jgi:hypothetical protein
VLVERGDRRVLPRQPQHRRVQLDLDGLADVRVLQHLTHREPVAAAEDQHAVALAREHRVHERLVVAVLVERAELQIPVQEQPGVLRPVDHRRRLGEHDVLVLRGFRVDDRVLVQLVAGVAEERVALGERERQHRQHTGRAEGEREPALRAHREHEQRDRRAGDRVDHADEQRTPGLAE